MAIDMDMVLPKSEMQLKKPNILYNVSGSIIMIVTEWKRDRMGGPAVWNQHTALLPGEGVDLEIVGLSLKAPKKKVQAKKPRPPLKKKA